MTSTNASLKFAKFLKKTREENRMTMEEASALCGISRNQWFLFERDGDIPSKSTIKKIMKGLNGIMEPIFVQILNCLYFPAPPKTISYKNFLTTDTCLKIEQNLFGYDTSEICEFHNIFLPEIFHEQSLLTLKKKWKFIINDQIFNNSIYLTKEMMLKKISDIIENANQDNDIDLRIFPFKEKSPQRPYLTYSIYPDFLVLKNYPQVMDYVPREDEPDVYDFIINDFNDLWKTSLTEDESINELKKIKRILEDNKNDL